MAVRTSEEWKNPYLMATATGFELKSASSPQPRVVLVKNLQQELAAWVEALDRNIEEARKILKALEQRNGDGQHRV